MTKSSVLWAAIVCLGIGVGPQLLHADMIHGMVKGSTVTGTGPDDRNTVTTVDIIGLASSSILASAIDNSSFSEDHNFVFAGLGVAQDIPILDPGDFTVNQYTPWVVNNYPPQPGTAGKNYIVGPDGGNYGAGIHFKDAGGVNFVLSYQRQFKDEPTMVNFIQAYTESENGGAFTAPILDTPSETGKPYYNDGALAGSGTTLLSGKGMSQVPLPSSSRQAAWMIDIPFVCEDGGPSDVNRNCANGKDETITSYSVTYVTFIESTQTLSGKPCTDGQPGCYDILYGGVEWGYSYTAVDTPEPPSLLLLAGSLAAVGMWSYGRSSRAGLDLS